MRPGTLETFMESDPTSARERARGGGGYTRAPLSWAQGKGRAVGAVLQRQSTATGLGWLSIGLGLSALLAPRTLGEWTGLENRTGLLRAIGARELLSGAGLLARPEDPTWLWSRVVGDLIDIAVLASAGSATPQSRRRRRATLAVVSAIGAADLATALQRTSFTTSPFKAARGASPDVYLERTILVNKSQEECYAFWREFRNMTRFSPRLESVTHLDSKRSHWSLRLTGNRRMEWDAEITSDVPNERIQWRTLSGAPFQHAGAVHFDKAPGNRGTFVKVSMHYRAPGGALGSILAQVLGPDPFGEIRENLRRFKQLLETGEIPTTAGQPAGRRSVLSRWLPGAGRLREPPPRKTQERSMQQEVRA